MPTRPPDRDFDEFKGHLVRRHRQNCARRQKNPTAPLDNAAAERFGRYLCAARRNANLSPAALGQRANLPPDTIMALEMGLILAPNIKASWLKRLAAALNEDPADFALLLGRRHSGWWSWPAFNRGYTWPALRLTRNIYAPLFASLVAVIISVTLLARAGLPLSPAGDALIDLTPESLAPPVAPAAALASDYTHLNPANRPSLLKAERLKIAPAVNDLPPAVSLPPVVETNRVTSRFLNSVLPVAPSPPKERIQVFFDSVYWLTVGPRFQLEGRPSIITAEFGLENQILILPKLINVDSDERLNMVKAEIRL